MVSRGEHNFVKIYFQIYAEIENLQFGHLHVTFLIYRLTRPLTMVNHMKRIAARVRRGLHQGALAQRVGQHGMHPRANRGGRLFKHGHAEPQCSVRACNLQMPAAYLTFLRAVGDAMWDAIN